MNRLTKTFQRLKQEQKKAFIGFLTAGDPTIETSIACALTMERNGCDIIEVGVPFSDPMAEGPIIQAASERALLHHIKTDDVMNMIRTLRKQTQLPLVYLLYFNQLYTYGIERFLQESANAGIDALIIPDLPYEHQEEVKPLAKRYGIILISLITPASSKRKEQIAKESEGFLYCVTSLGVTGERDHFSTDLKAYIEELNNYSATPKALGFGISTPQQVLEFKDYADGIIVGSAIVHQIERLAKEEITMDAFGSFVKQFSDAAHAK